MSSYNVHESLNRSDFVTDEEEDLNMIDIGIIHTEQIKFSDTVAAVDISTEDITPNLPVTLYGWGVSMLFPCRLDYSLSFQQIQMSFINIAAILSSSKW